MILSENIRRNMWVMTRPEGRAPAGFTDSAEEPDLIKNEQ
jgi:hypothetical protein